MFFGKLKGTEDEWGFDVDSARFDPCTTIDDSEHMRIINEANSNGKLIKGDEEGKPILVDPPEPTDEEKARQRIAELENYLSSTDWYAIRFADTGEEIPSEIKNNRQDARDEISRLREEYPEPNKTKGNEEYSELGSEDYDENGDHLNHQN